MAISLKKGQRVDLTKTNPGIKNIKVCLGWDVNSYAAGADFDLDTAAFLLDAAGKVPGEKEFVYYGNLKHPSGAVEHMGDNTSGGGEGDDEIICINLQTVPGNIEKIDFTVTIYEAASRKQNFGQVNNAYIRVVDTSTNQEIIRYDLGEDFSVETAVVVGEIYRHNGEWKFSAIGSGFDGGLDALCSKYGVNIKSSANRYGNRSTAVELKKGQKVSLEKRGGALGEILINLNWKQPQQKGMFSLFSNNNIDLDLACLYELKDGSKGVVQALGNCFGSLDRRPFIALDGDDRTGNAVNGENIRINGARISDIKRILIFTFIYEGAANWKCADGVVTVKCPGSRDIIVRMDEYGSDKKTCAIALLENVNDTFSVEKIVEFFNGHMEIDRAFHWGLQWRAGHK